MPPKSSALKRRPIKKSGINEETDEVDNLPPPTKRIKKQQAPAPIETKKKKAEQPVKSVKPKPKAGNTTAKAKFELHIENFVSNQKADLILSCGNGDTGQLGNGDGVTSCKRPRVVQNLPKAKKFVQIVAGGMHSAVLTDDHDVYTCGCNDEGALGRDCFEDDGKTKRDDDQDFIFRHVEFEDRMLETHGDVVLISAGDSHTAALTDKGSVIIWGTFRDKGGCLGVSLNADKHGVVKKSIRPVLLSSFAERRIVKIASGYNHLAMLTKDGSILTVGAGDAGQLGRLAPQFRDSSVSHRTRTTMLTPKEVGVRAKPKVHFENLWCTGYCCYARNSDGQIFIWGLNNYFQLGFVPFDSDQTDVHSPIPSQQFKLDSKWTQFAGDHHILALNSNGEVFVIGRGADARLGLGNNEDQQVLQKLKITSIAGVAASNSSSFAWTEDGTVFVWGYNLDGELGLGIDENEAVETPTKIVAKSLENCRVTQISAGGQHTLMLAKKVEEKLAPQETVKTKVNNVQSKGDDKKVDSDEVDKNENDTLDLSAVSSLDDGDKKADDTLNSSSYGAD